MNSVTNPPSLSYPVMSR